MDIELNIEELRLHGFRWSDRDKIAMALQDELERLFGEEGLPQSFCNGEGIRLEGGSFLVPKGASPQQVGAEVARQMYGGWK